MHFFSETYSNDDFNEVLINGNKNILKTLEDSYLGFIVIKPIENSIGEPLIGRTILRTYPSEIGEEKRFYLKGSYDVSLFGIPLKVESLPFQTQDTAVGACATAACWISLHPLSDLFGIQKYSPFEVTEMSVSFPALARNFPSEGLTLFQIKSHFNSIGLETEFIHVKKFITSIKEYRPNDDVVADAVRAYSKMGLPIIAGLGLKKGRNSHDYHAAVISGYRHKKGVLKELYVHDDQIGPYSKVRPNGQFTKWKNEWLENGYSEVSVETLIIPIYPKLRLSFVKIYTVFLKYKRTIEMIKILDEKLTPELYLMDIKQYKKFLWKHSFEKKDEILFRTFPRFLWIIRIHFHGIPIIDYLYDGTSVFPTKIDNIVFNI